MDYSNLLNQAQVYSGEVGERKADEERKVDEKASGEASIGSQLEQLGVPGGAAVAGAIAKTEAGQRGIAAAKQASQGVVDKVSQAVSGGPAPTGETASTTTNPAFKPSDNDVPFPEAEPNNPTTADLTDAGTDAPDLAATDAATEGVGAALDATGVLAPIGALISLFAPAVAGAIELGITHHETENEVAPDLSGVGAPVYTPGLN